jgi:hypothetical protein
MKSIAITRPEELVGGDDFNALSYIFGEQRTTVNLQGRGSFLNTRIRQGILLGQLYISETALITISMLWYFLAAIFYSE